MLAEIPAIAEIVIALDELDAIALFKSQLVRATGYKVIWQQGLAPTSDEPAKRVGNITYGLQAEASAWQTAMEPRP